MCTHTRTGTHMHTQCSKAALEPDAGSQHFPLKVVKSKRAASTNTPCSEPDVENTHAHCFII